MKKLIFSAVALIAMSGLAFADVDQLIEPPMDPEMTIAAFGDVGPNLETLTLNVLPAETLANTEAEILSAPLTDVATLEPLDAMSGAVGDYNYGVVTTATGLDDPMFGTGLLTSIGGSGSGEVGESGVMFGLATLGNIPDPVFGPDGALTTV